MNRQALITALKTGNKDEVYNHLRQDPKFTENENKQVNYGNGTENFDLRNLALWLVSRMNQVGAESTVKEIEKFLALDRVPGAFFMEIQGIKVNSKMSLYKDIQIEPYNENVIGKLFGRLADSIYHEQAEIGYVNFEELNKSNRVLTELQQLRLASARLSVQCDSMPKFIAPSSMPNPDLFQSQKKTMEEICYLLSLHAKSVVTVTAYYWEPEAWIPRTSESKTIIVSHFQNLNQRVLEDSDINDIKFFLDDYYKFENARILIAAEYIHQVLLKLDNSRVVELFIAIEGIFMKKNSGSHKKGEKIAEKIGEYLDGQLPNKEAAVEMFKNLYIKRNDYIHEGNLDESKQMTADINTAIHIFQQVCRKILSEQRFPS